VKQVVEELSSIPGGNIRLGKRQREEGRNPERFCAGTA